MTAAAVFVRTGLVRSAVATSVGAAASAAVLVVAHREQFARRPAGAEAGGGCPMRRVLGRVPGPRTAGGREGAGGVAECAIGYPEYSV